MRKYLCITLFAAAFLVLACGGGGGGNGSAEVVQLGDVGPYFPSAGADWNDYVKNDQASIYTASDTAATGTETGGYLDALIHGGEMRALPVPGLSTCPGNTATDALGAFDWACVEIGGNVRMVSTGLKEGRYLSDLIDFGTGQWKENSVTVYSGGYIYGRSTTTAWWSNPVIEDNDGGTLSTEGAVYIVTADPQATFTISADRIALVPQPGLTISGPGASGAVVWASGFDFLWFEGALNAENDNMGFQLANARFGVIRGAQVRHALSSGVLLSSSHGYLLNDIEVSDNFNGLQLANTSTTRVSNLSAVRNDEGVRTVTGSTDITLINISSAANEGMGLRIEGGSNHLLSNIKSYNNGGYGMYLNGCSDSILSNILTVSNFNNGIQANGVNTVMMNISTVNGGNDGLRVTASGQTISGVAAVNNSYRGVAVQSATDTVFANVAAAENEFYGISLSGADNSIFTGPLKVGGNLLADCSVGPGTNVGLVDQTCLNAGDSDAVLSTGVNVLASFVGKVTTDDAASISDSNGTAPFNSISDWNIFENVYRTWGRDGAAFASTTHQGYADSTETCRIWDWSLAAGDTGDAGSPVLLDALTLPSGDDTLSHAWAGTTTISTFLRNAQEILDDRVGNDNLLCESGEVCQYLPDIGGYQGHGAVTSAGPFTNGEITGVILIKYAVNGR